MKYVPLENFLRETPEDVHSLSFADVEAIIGQPLPPSARKHEAWWSNNPTGHVNAQAWLRAGYRAEQIDIDNGHVVFRKTTGGNPSERRHPAFGALAGMVRVMPGVDLTEPADSEWGSLSE
ncbi:hypothetical protein QO010_003113 [Caulobacter ginsengisoli]|uniref:DUF7662 domain-containing protein n=1 Tax=Caulobacter ginsengisoli TaxID=400775 RepID=A0ABU0ITJ4_9CAUL|nr:hypothetical protein [Caulobacter ginsengisoli]MDQ0465326.1 hypothetical protein [Caulobacter ginsengisoli]